MTDFGAFSFDVTKRILDVLKREGPLKRTNLATKAGLNYNVCARYLALLSAINWIEMVPDVSITDTGRRISEVLLDSDSLKTKKTTRQFSINQENTASISRPKSHKTSNQLMQSKRTSQQTSRTISSMSSQGNSKLPKVMIVDDEHDVGLTFQSFLTGICDSHIFSDPYDALREFAASPKEIDLVVLDIRIPEMNGLQLYRSLAAINKDCKFLFVSALDAAGELLSIFPEIHPREIIKKPVERETFNRAVIEILARDRDLLPDK